MESKFFYIRVENLSMPYVECHHVERRDTPFKDRLGSVVSRLRRAQCTANSLIHQRLFSQRRNSLHCVMSVGTMTRSDETLTDFALLLHLA